MAPAGPRGPYPTTQSTGSTSLLGGEAAMAPLASQEQEEVRVALEKFHGYGGLRVSPDGIILGTDTQNWDGHFVYIP